MANAVILEDFSKIIALYPASDRFMSKSYKQSMKKLSNCKTHTVTPPNPWTCNITNLCNCRLV